MNPTNTSPHVHCWNTYRGKPRSNYKVNTRRVHLQTGAIQSQISWFLLLHIFPPIFFVLFCFLRWGPLVQTVKDDIQSIGMYIIKKKKQKTTNNKKKTNKKPPKYYNQYTSTEFAERLNLNSNTDCGNCKLLQDKLHTFHKELRGFLQELWQPTDCTKWVILRKRNPLFVDHKQIIIKGEELGS